MVAASRERGHQADRDDEDIEDLSSMFTELITNENDNNIKDVPIDDYDGTLNYALNDEELNQSEVILIDSGCNRLAVNKKKLFTNLDENKTRLIKTALKKSIIHVKGVGEIGCLKNVYFCPDSSENLCGVNIINEWDIHVYSMII